MRQSKFRALLIPVLGFLGFAAAPASAQVIGPDVTYQNITGTVNYGLVGEIRAYFWSSDTCNMGDQNLHWGGSWQGSPSLATNLYRIYNGRMMQIGQSWCKQACCAAAGGGCGTCNGTGGTLLGVGCKDVYGASYNGGQTRLAPRSYLNAWTGATQLAPTNTGNAIFKRLQVENKEVDPASYATATWIAEGQYVANDELHGAQYNNASWKPMLLNATTRDLTPTGTMRMGQPAIYAWAAMGGPGGTADPSVTITPVDIPDEGRFFVATKVTPLSGGRYTYDYAIFNLNSDRSAASLAVGLSANLNLTGVGFHSVPYHSGEVYDNTPWGSARNQDGLAWRGTQTFAQNPNANALRCGNMYNFFFTTTSAPQTGQLTIGLFKPGSVPSISLPGPVPTPVCGTADFDRDASIGTDEDIMAFYACLAGNCCATCQSADFNADGDRGTDADIESFFRVLAGGAC